MKEMDASGSKQGQAVERSLSAFTRTHFWVGCNFKAKQSINPGRISLS